MGKTDTGNPAHLAPAGRKLRAGLVERLGEPQEWLAGGRFAVWVLDPEGDAIVAARVDGAEAAVHETAKALAQIEAGRVVFGARCRLIVAGLGISGVAARSERADLDLIEAEASAGTCKAVYWHRSDRISRDPTIALAHVQVLHSVATAVYLRDFGHCLDAGGADDVLLGEKLRSREQVIRRMQQGRERRRDEAGS